MVNRFIMDSNGPFVYFDSDQNKRINTTVLNKGGAVINLNSELQGYIDDPDQMQKNFIKVINYASKICLSGQAQIEPLSRFVPENRIKDLVVTGHPSFDLASHRFIPYYTNKDIIRNHGRDYILMNTSFGMFNHEMGFENYLNMLSKMQEWAVYTTPEHRAHLQQRYEHEEKTATAFIELAKVLSKQYPNKHIIIRPHPAESMYFYTKQLSNYPNIFVTKKNSVRQWIVTAGAIVHHDCTTGLEALLMDKLVIQYQPDTDTQNSSEFMNRIGVRTNNSNETIALIDSGHMPKTIRHETLESLRLGMDNLDGCASIKLADLAISLSTDTGSWMPKPLGLWGNIKCWRKYASKLLRARQPGRNGKKVRYALNKFSRLKKNDIETKLHLLRSLEPELPKFEVQQLCLNNYLIKPAPKS